MKSSSNATNNDDIEHEDDVSEMSLSESHFFLHNSSSDESLQRRSDKSYLFDKFLNSSSMSFRSNGACNSLSSRHSSASSGRDSSSTISLKSLKQLESQMLYGDLRRESFRARAGTRNFCLNPLFEEGFPSEKRTRPDNDNDDEYENVLRGISLSSSCSHSSRISECSSDEIRVNCVEEIFVELSKVRRCASVTSSRSSENKSVDGREQTSFVVDRCNSLKRSERLLK